MQNMEHMKSNACVFLCQTLENIERLVHDN